jgi:hypothetical protein
MTKRKEVYALKLVGGKMDWHHIGHALESQDGSLTVQLDVLPTTTLLEIREVEQLAEVG